MKHFDKLYFPAYLGEKAQYLARESNDNTIRLALFYKVQIEQELLCQATTTLIQRIDILHSSFETTDFKARWKINTEFHSKEAFTFWKTESDIRAKVHEAMLKSIAFDGKLQVHCTLISNNEESAIVLRVGHMCADGRDAQYLLEKLIEIYNCLSEARDVTLVSLKNGTRNPEQCSNGLSFKDRIKLYWGPSTGNKTEYVYADREGGEPRIMYRTLPAELVSQVRKKGKEYHASMNDLLLTALYRATAKQMGLSEGQGMGIQSMMDLRRRMPTRDSLGVCNLSASLQTELKEGVNGDFADTLKEIVAQTIRAKNDPLSGLYDFPMMSGILRVFSFSMIQKLGAKVYGSATMGMTNLGALNGEKLAVVGCMPCEVILGAPLKQKPAFQLAVIGMNEEICMSAMAVCTERDELAVHNLLEDIQVELEQFCN